MGGSAAGSGPGEGIEAGIGAARVTVPDVDGGVFDRLVGDHIPDGHAQVERDARFSFGDVLADAFDVEVKGAGFFFRGEEIGGSRGGRKGDGGGTGGRGGGGGLGRGEAVSRPKGDGSREKAEGIASIKVVPNSHGAAVGCMRGRLAGGELGYALLLRGTWIGHGGWGLDDGFSRREARRYLEAAGG
jgi:hypothetical protein